MFLTLTQTISNAFRYDFSISISIHRTQKSHRNWHEFWRMPNKRCRNFWVRAVAAEVVVQVLSVERISDHQTNQHHHQHTVNTTFSNWFPNDLCSALSIVILLTESWPFPLVSGGGGDDEEWWDGDYPLEWHHFKFADESSTSLTIQKTVHIFFIYFFKKQTKKTFKLSIILRISKFKYRIAKYSLIVLNLRIIEEKQQQQTHICVT